jgi:fatty-acid desaturase
VFWVGWSPIAAITALGLYLIRMFAITGFYHRYFSHKAFKTNHPWQFVVLLHATCTINSFDHMFGTRRYNTRDTSRNKAALALRHWAYLGSSFFP